MPTDPTQRTAMEIAALTRVLFGVTAPPPVSSLPPEPSELPEPVVDIPVPQEIPAPQPVASPAPVAPASLPMPEVPVPDIPMPDIPVVASLPVPATDNTAEPPREAPRRPAGPSPELLQEIAFLED